MPFFLLYACTWIPSSDLTKAILRSDDDGDGFQEQVDCDDDNPDIHPEAEDIAYDGIDSNCDEKDDYDLDGDGFVRTEDINKQTEGVASSGQLLGGDCDDTDASINPDQEDEWYDGVDTNCDDESEIDDFDQDGDGHAANGYPDINGSDCDDTNPTIFDGAPDTPYDGIDSNCDEKDDFDIDQDGYIPSEYEDAHAQAYPNGEFEVLGGDCNDENSEVNPGQTEVWYDGVDSNCDGLNDYDQDGDGYVPDELCDDLLDQDGDGLIDCDDSDCDRSELCFSAPDGSEGTSPLPTGDCDDTNPLRTPEAKEILNDLDNDRDCNGSADSFSVEGIDWTFFDILTQAPDAVQTLRSSSNSSHHYVAMFSEPTLGVAPFYPLAISFDRETLEADSYFSWATIPYEYSSGMSIQVTDDYFFGLFGESNPGLDRWIHITARSFAQSTITHRRAFANEASPEFTDFSLIIEDDGSGSNRRVHAVGCSVYQDSDSGYTLQYAMNPINKFFNSNGLENEGKYTDPSLRKCKLYNNLSSGSSSAGELIGLDEENQLVGYDLTFPESSLVDPPTFTLGETYNTNNTHSELLLLDRYSNPPLLLRNGSTVLLWEDGVETALLLPELSTSTPVHAAQTDDNMLLLSVASANEGVILYGDPDAGASSFSTYHVSAEFDIVDVHAIYDDNRILVVAMGENDIAFDHAFIEP